MAVLIEGISVVIRRVAIDERYPGGWGGFMQEVPTATFCADTHLARVGFTVAPDVERFVTRLQEHGLVFVQGGQAVDIVVVDQRFGPTTSVDWLQFGSVPMGDGSATAGRLMGDTENVLTAPEGWTYEGSASQTPGYAEGDDIERDLEFVEHREGLDVFRDPKTGDLRYVSRADVPEEDEGDGSDGPADGGRGPTHES